MGLPVHSRCSPQCVCASVRLALSQILAIPTRIAHVVATIATILPQVARLVPRRGGIAVFQVLPYLAAVLADVLGVMADVLAVAAQLTAVVADFLAVVLHLVRVLGREHHRCAECQHYEEGDMTSHSWSRLKFAGKTRLSGRVLTA